MLLFIVTIISSACEEYELFKPKSQPVDSVKIDSTALLTWTGEYEVDGCGFLITIDSITYKPHNEEIINESFKQSASSGLNVIVEYKPLDIEIAYYCEDVTGPQILAPIQLFSIKRK